MNIPGFRIQESRSYWSKSVSYDLMKYTGAEPEVVIPEQVSHVDKNAFQGCNVTSLTFPAGFSSHYISSLSPIPTLKRVAFLYEGYFYLNMEDFLRTFPALEEISFPNADTGRIYFYRVSSQSLPLLRLTNPEIKAVYCELGRDHQFINLPVFAPWLSPGKMARECRCAMIDTFVRHMDWYEEAARVKILEWITKNGEKFFPLCMESGQDDLINTIVLQMNLRFPARTYDLLIRSAEEKGDPAAKASFLSAKNRHYDPMELSRKKEAMEEKDFDNPLRVHAMQKIWSWSKLEDKSLCIKKMKNDPDNDWYLSAVHIPHEIAGSPVVMASGPVFRDAKVKEVVFPKSVDSLRGKLFEGNNSVETVRFLGDVPFIPEGCFQRCDALRRVEFAQSGQWIGEEPLDFSAAENLSPTPLLILAHAFSECPNLSGLFLRQAILSNTSFEDSGFQSITLRDVRVIPERCFSGCDDLRSADIRGTVMIGFEGFSSCRKLEELHVSGHLVSLKQGVFSDCGRLRKIYIHNARYPAMVKKLFQGYRHYDDLEFVIEG